MQMGTRKNFERKNQQFNLSMTYLTSSATQVIM